MLQDDIPPHRAASSWSPVWPTGMVRTVNGKLQQEFAQDWWNELGSGTVSEWRDVPEVTE